MACSARWTTRGSVSRSLRESSSRSFAEPWGRRSPRPRSPSPTTMASPRRSPTTPTPPPRSADMARRPASPGRTLTIFFISVAVLYGLVALGGTWKPALGLDLEGGTRIRLAATGNDVTAESLKEAADIIDKRVNGSGVSEAEVTTEGNQYIVVEIPGQSRRDLVDTVKRQAQLRFRVVAMSG